MSKKHRRHDEITPLQWFLLELERIDATEFTLARVKAVVRDCLVGQRIYFARYALVKPESVKVARALLDVGCTVAATRDRLVDGGYCRSLDAAYRIVHEAIKQRGNELAQTMARSQNDLFREQSS